MAPVEDETHKSRNGPNFFLYFHNKFFSKEIPIQDLFAFNLNGSYI